jgi:DNA-binding response OmpR family regulator
MAIACGVPIDPRETEDAGPRHVDAPGPRSAAEARPDPESRLIIDADRPDRVMLDGKPVELRPAEFRLLKVLAETPQACVEYDVIYRGMWGDETFVEPAQIYSHRSRLASKLDDAVPGADDLLRTIPKRGIMLDLPADLVSAS